MGAMCRAESVVHIEIGEFGQLLENFSSFFSSSHGSGGFRATAPGLSPV